MENIKLNVRERIRSGRGAVRRLRAGGEIPAVIYGQREAVSIAVAEGDVRRVLREIAEASALIEISQDKGEPVLSIVQEVQRNPMTDAILHVDFLEVAAGEEMETAVNIQLLGEAVGVINENGTLDVVSHTINIRCLPKDLPGVIELDVSGLHIGESLHVKDLPEIKGVTYLAEEDHVIVSCLAPSLPVEEEEAEEAVADEAEAASEAEAEADTEGSE